MQLSVDSWGNVYIADEGNGQIRTLVNTLSPLVSLSPVVYNTTVYARHTHFTDIYDVVIDRHGFAHVSESSVHRVTMINSLGAVILTAGSVSGTGGYSDGVGTYALFRNPRGLDMDTFRDRLYVADSGNHCIRMINSLGQVSECIS